MVGGPGGAAPNWVQWQSPGGGPGDEAPEKCRLFVAKILKIEQSENSSNDILEMILDPLKRQ